MVDSPDVPGTSITGKRTEPTSSMNANKVHWTMRARQLGLAFIAAWACLGVLAGCASPGAVASATPAPTRSLGSVEPVQTQTPAVEASPSPSARTQVSIWSSWDPVELRALRNIIQVFTIGHPEIDFSLSYYPPGELLEAFMSCASSSDCPTLLIGPSRWGPSLAADGLVSDISALIDSQLQRDLFPVAWDQVVRGSVMTGMPLELQGNVLYRNTVLVPDQSSQFGELIEQARELEESTQLASYFDFGFYYSVPFLSTCGGELLDTAGEPTILGEAGICWLELLKNWAASGRIVIGGDEDLGAFLAGESGWLMESSLLKQSLIEVLGQDSLNVDPWPVYDETGQPLRGFVWSENVYFAAGLAQDELEAGWTFTRFLFSPEAQAILSDVSGPAHIPTLRSIALADPMMQAISEMLRSGVPLPLRADLDRFVAPIDGAIDDVVLQGADPVQALTIASDLMVGIVGTQQPQP